MSETWNTAKMVDLVETYADTHGNDDDYTEPNIYWDDDFTGVALWVDMPDGRTINNDEYREEVSDAQWAQSDGSVLERSWNE